MARAVRTATPKYEDNVFLNVPFDKQYLSLFRALVFAVHDCGYSSRCALESSNSGVIRLDKIYQIVTDCQFGIHDISRTALDSKNKLPRFNMPLELGVFLGARKYGNSQQKAKNCLILDRVQYRYQKFCSDISGQDIRPHFNKTATAISAVRNWLSAARPHPKGFIPDGHRMAKRYAQYLRYLPQACYVNNLRLATLDFLDYRTLLVAWLIGNPW
jgi:hypothetical protein